MFLAMLGEAWRSMGANRLRTFLTMLGMVIGAGAVVLMMAVGQGAEYKIRESISAMGSNLFILLAGHTTSRGARSASGGGHSLTIKDADAIAELPNIQNAAPIQSGRSQVIYGSNNWNTSIVGTIPSYFETRSWTITSGSIFSDSDVRSATRVALVGKTAAENLFGDEDPVGKTIRIKQSPFIILGTLGAKGQSMSGRDQDDTIIIPITTAQRQVFGSRFPGSVRMIMVQAISQEVMDTAEKSMTSLLRQRHRLREGMDNDFYQRNLTAMAEAEAENTRVMSMLLGAIASVSLLVGGIGIMNIMLVSVTERTREIGIRMAIGARERDILMQFLLEAIIISVAGCFIGLALGIGGAYLAEYLTDTFVIISGSSILLAFGVAATIGVFFGFYPARKAALMDPIEALRYQ
ncbi:MAG: ABC transporter permease [Gallionella sp.]